MLGFIWICFWEIYFGGGVSIFYLVFINVEDRIWVLVLWMLVKFRILVRELNRECEL